MSTFSAAPWWLTGLSHPGSGVCRERRQRDEGARAEWGTRRGLERQGLGPRGGDGWRSLSGLTGPPRHWPRQCLTQLLPPQSHYVACMAAILSQMDKDHYSSYIQAFPSRAELMVSAAPRSETWAMAGGSGHLHSDPPEGHPTGPTTLPAAGHLALLSPPWPPAPLASPLLGGRLLLALALSTASRLSPSP